MVTIAKGITHLICLMVILFTITSCSKKNYSTRAEYQFRSATGEPDYSDLNYWAAHPFKRDRADSIPFPLRKNSVSDSSADVFFIYPTTFTNKVDSNWNAAIDDPIINSKTDYSTILYQASAFNDQTRVFAPRYRQAHYRAFTSSNKQRNAAALELAYQDVKQSFEYYLQHFNHGRPIIIAAHSQGTIHAGHLIREFFDNKPLKKKLICAYLIGMPVDEHYFKSIPSCTDSMATGCFVSWRSYQKGYNGEPYIERENFNSVVTNPLTWTMSPDYAPASENKGTVLLNFNKISRGGSAQIHRNILWTAKPKFFGNILFNRKNYHVADINLFYMNIRENVGTRIRMYLKH